MSILTSICNFYNNLAPAYHEEIYCSIKQGQVTRFSFQKLILSCQKSNRGLRTLIYLGPRLWNNLAQSIKASMHNANCFKHNLKMLFLRNSKVLKTIHICFTEQHGLTFKSQSIPPPDSSLSTI